MNALLPLLPLQEALIQPSLLARGQPRGLGCHPPAWSAASNIRYSPHLDQQLLALNVQSS